MEKTKEIIEKIREYTLEDIMGERFSAGRFFIEISHVQTPFLLTHQHQSDSCLQPIN